MQNSFDSKEFVNRAGRNLVVAFDNARQLATTPELVGDAMEYPVVEQLGQILPNGIGIGSGCVIDTKGATSRQMDVVLYERDICPVFCVNNSPETTYYPCEGVIAVGEVKSRIGKTQLEDAFEKMRSVKSLKRNFDAPKLPSHKGRKVFEWRRYGQTAPREIVDLNYNPADDYFNDIFGFVLAGDLEVKAETMLRHYVRLVNQSKGKTWCPNMMVSLSGEMFFPSKIWSKQSGGFTEDLQRSIRMSNAVSSRRDPFPFSVLVTWLHDSYRNGKTSDIAVFEKYLLDNEKESELLGSMFLESASEPETKPIVKERCCMDRGGDGIRPFPSGSVRRYARTQAVRVRSLCSGLFGRVGSP